MKPLAHPQFASGKPRSIWFNKDGSEEREEKIASYSFWSVFKIESNPADTQSPVQLIGWLSYDLMRN